MNEKAPKEAKEKCWDHGGHGFCFCQAILAILIIVLVWWWTPSWANIAITVLAVLLLLGSFGCCCSKMTCKPKK